MTQVGPVRISLGTGGQIVASGKLQVHHFSTTALLTCKFRQSFVARGCPVHCKMLNSIPGFSPLVTNSHLPAPVVTTPKISWRCHISLGWAGSKIFHSAEPLCQTETVRHRPGLWADFLWRELARRWCWYGEGRSQEKTHHYAPKLFCAPVH